MTKLDSALIGVVAGMVFGQLGSLILFLNRRVAKANARQRSHGATAALWADVAEAERQYSKRMAAWEAEQRAKAESHA